MSSKKSKIIPRFKTEKQEREFWSSHDSTSIVDWSRAQQVVFPNLKPSTRTISIRLPESLLYEVKVAANEKDVPYQTYIKILLSQAVQAQKTQDQKTAIV